MREARPTRHRLPPPLPHEGGEPDTTFPALHWMTAALFLAAGTEALLRQRGAPRETGPLDRPHRASRAARDALRVAPLAAAPLASIAHIARAVTNGPRLRLATQLLDGVAVGVAAAGLATAAYDALGQPTTHDPATTRVTRTAARFARALVPITLGGIAVLGMLLETEEEKEREKVRRLRRRASVVERLVPRRQARFDHIVLHI